MKTPQSSFRRSSSVLSVLFVCLLFISSCNTDSTSKEDKTNQETTTVSNSDTNSEENSYSNNGNSNTINNKLQPNSLRPIYSNTDSDENTDEQDLYASLSAKDSSEFFKRFAPKTQIFNVSNNDEQDIYCELGTYIHIDSGSFIFVDGSPVTSPVIFKVKEFYDKQTVLLSGLATNHKKWFFGKWWNAAS